MRKKAMKNKILISCLLIGIASSAFAVPVVNLINNTNCELVDGQPINLSKAVTVYSYYYINNNQLKYYGFILANESGNAAVSPQPNIGPGMMGINLGYKLNDPSNLFAAVGITSGAHIVQQVWSDTNCTKQSPCLDVESSNPCQ